VKLGGKRLRVLHEGANGGDFHEDEPTQCKNVPEFEEEGKVLGFEDFPSQIKVEGEDAEGANDSDCPEIELHPLRRQLVEISQADFPRDPLTFFNHFGVQVLILDLENPRFFIFPSVLRMRLNG
jgi:hypothetical protein